MTTQQNASSIPEGSSEEASRPAAGNPTRSGAETLPDDVKEALRLFALLVDATERYHIHSEVKAVITIGAVMERAPRLLRKLFPDD